MPMHFNVDKDGGYTLTSNGRMISKFTPHEPIAFEGVGVTINENRSVDVYHNGQYILHITPEAELDKMVHYDDYYKTEGE